MKTKLVSLALLFATSVMSCQKEETSLTPLKPNELKPNESSVLKSDLTSKARLGTGCSYPYSGTNYSWSNTGSKSLATHQSSDKKYIWRTSSAPNIKFKVTLNTNYPIVVRCVGVKGIITETYELYDGCYDLTSNGSTKEFSFNAPGSYNWLGNWIYTYDKFDFEIIVKNRSGAGKSNTTVPVTIKTCASTNGICVGY